MLSIARGARSDWYVAGYTFCDTIATAVVPHQILPIFGFDDPVLPWERITGLLFFALCVFNVVVAREKGSGPIILAILTLRSWFIVVLITLGLLGYPRFVWASAIIVGVGVAGTIVTYRPSGSRTMCGRRQLQLGSDLSSAQMQSRKETRSSFSCLFSRKPSTMSKNSTTS